MREKRSAEEEPNHVALTPTARVKPQKRGPVGGVSGGQFSLRRRRYRADELEFDDMVCPINEGVPNNNSSSISNNNANSEAKD